MKKLKFFTLAIAILGFTSISFAQVTASATAAANIITPISIVNAGDMNFGNLAVSTTAGTVVLTPAGERSETGGVTLPATAGSVSAAKFTVEGLANSTYSITLPSGNHTIKSGTNTMIVNAFTSSPTPTGTLNASGTETILVGATLNVAGSQAAGSYVSETGFEVTVNYN